MPLSKFNISSVAFVATLIGSLAVSTTSAAMGGGGVDPLPDGSTGLQLPHWLADFQPAGEDALYGSAIASSNQFIVVAAPNALQDQAEPDRGVVLVYSAKGQDPQFTPLLEGVIDLPWIEGDPVETDAIALAVYGNTIVVGNGAALNGRGAVYFYDMGMGLGGPYHALKGKVESGRLGSRLALSQSGRLAIGAPGGDSMVFVAEIDNDGDVNMVTQFNRPQALESQARFGESLAFLDDRLLIGAPLATVGKHVFCGRAYQWIWDADSPLPLVDLLPPEPSSLLAFGSSMASSGPYVAVGAPGFDTINPGKVILFENDGAESLTALQTIESDIPGETDGFGTSVSFSGEPFHTLAVGVLGADDAAADSGACCIFELAGSDQSWVETGRLSAYHALPYAGFGQNVGFISDPSFGYSDQKTLLIGAPGSGRAYRYFSPDPAAGWVQDIRVPAPIRIEQGLAAVGSSSAGTDVWDVAIDGNRMVVSESDGDDGSPLVRLIERQGDGSWATQHTWTAPDNSSTFGWDVDISGDVVVFSDRYGDSYTGKAWLSYFLDSSGSWSSLVSISAPDEAWEFGNAVTIDNPGGTWEGPATIIVGEAESMWAQNITGKAHVFHYQYGYTVQTHTLTPDNLTQDTNPAFGSSLDMHEGLLVVGAPWAEAVEAEGGCSVGAVYIYDDFDSNPVYCPSPLTVGDGGVFGTPDCHEDNSGGTFGASVATNGTQVVVGAPYSNTFVTEDRPNTGAAVVLNSGGEVEGLLRPMDIQPGDRFGTSVAIADDRIIVGAPQSDYQALNGGAAWNFSATTGKCSEAMLVGSPTVNARLGSAVAVSAATNGPMTIYTSAVAAPDLANIDDDGEGAVALYFGGDVANWVAEGNGYWEADGNSDGLWSMAPEDATLMRFSRFLGNSFIVEVWDSFIYTAVDVFVADVVLMGDSVGDTLQIAGQLSIAGPVEMGVSRLLVDQLDPMQVDGPILLGSPGHSGELSVAPEASVQANAGMMMAASGSLGINTSGAGQTGRVTLPSAAGLSIAGTCTLIDYGGTFELGDELVLLQSASIPDTGEDAFDMVVLPGLDDDLAFQLSYGLVDSVQGTLWQVTAEVVDIADLIAFGEGGSYAVDGDPVDMVLTDLTGDGADEICVLFGGSPGSLYIFENDGTGGIAQQIIVSAGDGPIDLASGDIDGNGEEDLIVAAVLSSELLLLFNDGDYTDGFSEVDFSLTDPPSCVAAINIDDDDLDDLAVGFPDTDADGYGRLELYYGAMSVNGGGLGGGGGSDIPGDPLIIDPSENEDQKDALCYGVSSDGDGFAAKSGAGVAGASLDVAIIPAGTDLTGVANGDFDGDGDEDIALCSSGSDQLIVLLRDGGNWNWNAPLYSPLGTDPAGVIARDFDGDGTVDLAALTTNPSGNRVVRVLQNDGSLSFTSIDTAEGDDPALLAAGDVGGTGSVDLITVTAAASLNGPTQLVEVRPQEGSCPGDLDQSGAVGIDDLLLLIAAWSADCEGGADCSGDLDGDLDIDVDDLVTLIGLWGPC